MIRVEISKNTHNTLNHNKPMLNLLISIFTTEYYIIILMNEAVNTALLNSGTFTYRFCGNSISKYHGVSRMIINLNQIKLKIRIFHIFFTIIFKTLSNFGP